MSAVVKNKCEYEAIQLIKEVASILGIPLEIDSEALQEGGLKEVWKFVGENSAQLSLILVVVTIVFSRYPPSNSELGDLQKQELTLSIEEKKLKIRKLKIELLKENALSNQSIDECAEIVNQQIKVTKHKSNYYENLIPYGKVEQIGFGRLDEFSRPVEDEIFVQRKDFHKYVLIDNDLSTEVDESAILHIVSPVLEKGRYKWRGVYQNEVISFSMKDSLFKESVFRKEITFQNGTFIEAVLEKNRKINNFGEIEISGYAVTTVLSISDGNDIIVEPKQARGYKSKKQQDANQLMLFCERN